MNETVGLRLLAEDMASGPIAAVRKELMGLGGAAGGIASSGMSALGRVAGGISGGLSHLKNTVTGLITGPLGFLGLGVGAFTVAGALKKGIDTALGMAAAIEKLTGITHDSAESLSALIAVANKYGISTEQLITSSAFATKTLQKLNSSYTAGKDPVTKLAAFQKQYGINLVDSKGHMVDFETELNRVSDYMHTAKGRTEGATVAAQLFGRGYAALIPILNLGSKGIAEAEAAAKSLGLTLTATNVADLQKYQETMRDLGDSVGGLELQLSLALIPAVSNLAKAATHFIADNRAGIVGFFTDLIAKAQTAAAFITGTIIPDLASLAGAAIGFWNSIPPEWRDIIVKGLVADRAIHFLFGFDALGLGLKLGESFIAAAGKGLLGLLSGSVGNAAGGALGSLVGVQKVWVMNPGFGAPAGGPVSAAESGGGLLAGLGITGGTLSVLGAQLALTALAANALSNAIDSKGGWNSTAVQDAFKSTGGQPPLGKGGGGIDTRTPAQIAAAYASKYGGSTPGPNQDALSAIKEASMGIAELHVGMASNLANATLQKGLSIWNAILRVDQAQLAEHHKAKAGVGGSGKAFHDFLLELRHGSIAMAVKDAPKEVQYMLTASLAQQKSAVFQSGLRQDIAALQRAEVGATTDQKRVLQSAIEKLKLKVTVATSVTVSKNSVVGTVMYSNVYGHSMRDD